MSTEAKPAAMQQIIEALSVAVRQNSHDMVMTGPEVRQCEFALSAARAMQVQMEGPIAWGSGDGYWVRSEDKPLRPDADRFTVPFFGASPAVSAQQVEAVQEAPATEAQQPAAWLRDEWNGTGQRSVQLAPPSELSLRETAIGVVYTPLYAAPIQQAAVPEVPARWNEPEWKALIAVMSSLGYFSDQSRDPRINVARFAWEAATKTAPAPKPEALEAAPSDNAAQLAKHQPCGFVICTCEDEERCHGCGAKHCGAHPIGQFSAALSGVAAPAGASTAGVETSGPVHSCKNCEHFNKSSCEEPCAGCTVRWRSGVGDRWELASTHFDGLSASDGQTDSQQTPMGAHGIGSPSAVKEDGQHG